MTSEQDNKSVLDSKYCCTFPPALALVTVKINISLSLALNITKTRPCKMKTCDIFLIFAQNIDCGYTLYAVLTSTHNQCFGAKIRKKKYTPVNPSFTI